MKFATRPAPDATRSARVEVVSRQRLLLTTLGTLAVVLTEFALLHSVYHLGGSTRRAQVAVAQVQGQLAGATPAQAHRSVAATQAALGALPAGGRDQALAVRAARQFGRVANQPNLHQLRTSVDELAATLRADNAHASVVADLIYAGLLILASFGWMAWFRRLVARHRKLQQQMTETQLKAEGDQRLAALVRNAADLVVLCTDGFITFATPSSHAVLGLAPESLIGRPWVDLIADGGRDAFAASLSSLRPNEDRDITVRMRHANGALLHMEGVMTDLSSDPVVGALLVTVRDVTSRVDLETRLRHQAFYDSLTGLPNRQLFSDRLSHALARAGLAGGESVAVLFCDLDEFKNVNDSLGHPTGDVVLSAVARRAESVVSGADTVARLGGDEFAILLEDTTVHAALRVAHDVLAALSEPIEADGHSLLVRASIGLAMGGGGNSSSGEEMLRNADVAMYLAKERGKGTVATYDGELHSLQLDRLILRAELEEAIAEHDLSVHYQPIIDLRDRSIAGFEALVRWHHPTRGILPPAEFISIAEKHGLITDLGRVVLRAACRAGADFNLGSEQTLYISVNVAAQQLGQPGFVDDVRAALGDSGLLPSLLVVEITETALLDDMAMTVAPLAELRALGVRIAVDDFGTGYSSLAYLRDLPLDILKVDKAFVDRVASDSQHAALTRAIIAMSRCLNLMVIAEGVETEAQARWLTKARCAYGQGFLWSRPVSEAQAVGLLTTLAAGSGGPSGTELESTGHDLAPTAAAAATAAARV